MTMHLWSVAVGGRRIARAGKSWTQGALSLGIILAATMAEAVDADELRTRLVKIGRGDSFVYAWSTAGSDWTEDGFDRFRRETGVSPLMYFAEFRDIGGTWYDHAAYAGHRRAFADTVKRQWAQHRAVPLVTWHIQNPYIPPKWRDVKYGRNAGMRYRYSSPDYPQEHRYVLREIATGTGTLCGTGRIDGVSARTFANPREWYLWSLRDVAAFCRTLVDETGARIPIVFRPFHEMDGDWFWWGQDSASPEDFIAVFRLTVDVLRKELGAKNVLFAYGTDRLWKQDQLGAPGKGGFLNWYPGDAYVDIVGYDDYSIGKAYGSGVEKTTADAIARLRTVSDFAREHGKSCGLFETGMKDSVDNFYSLLHKVATAEGIDVAIVTTYDGPWTFPTNDVGRADMRRVLALPEVLTSANPGDFAGGGRKRARD